MKKISEYFEDFREMKHKLDMTKVYIGIYSIDNQESLFYKLNFDTYYDLKSKRNVSCQDIQKDSLIPYNNVIKCDSNLQKNIIKVYDLDRIQKVSLSRVYIGNSYQITEIVGRESYGKSFINGGVITSVKSRLVEEDLLLFATSRSLDYADFINLENGDRYKPLYYLEQGDIYIPVKNNLTAAAFELNICGKDVEKKKILEKYREYKRR